MNERVRSSRSRSQSDVVFVCRHPVQHFAPAFRALYSSHSASFCVLYRSTPGSFFDPGFATDVTWDVDLISGYTSETAGRGVAGLLCIFRTLVWRRPKMVVVFGWGSKYELLAIFLCVLSRRRFLLYGDSTIQHSNVERRGWLREFALRRLCKRASGALSTGAFNRGFYEKYGMDRSAIFDSCYPIDTARFAAAGRQLRTPMNETGHMPTILYVGKLIERKGVATLVDALAAIKDLDWACTIAGAGPEEGSLRSRREQQGLCGRISFRGFVNQSEIPALLATHDLVVVPSLKDFRTLAVAEAMCTGALVLVSDGTAVWGPSDLIEDGISGFLFPAGDDAALAAKMRGILEQGDFPAIRAEAVRRSSTQSPMRFAESVVDALLGG